MRKFFTFIMVVVTTLVSAQQTYTVMSIKETPPYQVGQEITVRFEWMDNMNDAPDPNPTYFNFDWRYNNKLLQKVSHTFILANNPNATKSFNHWDGYIFNPHSGVGPADLYGQYTYMGQGLAKYVGNADWSIERVAVQDATEIRGLGWDAPGTYPIVEVKYKVKDKIGTNYTDWSNALILDWALIRDNATYTTYSNHAQFLSLDLGNVGGAAINAVKLTLLANNTHKSEYSYQIFTDLIWSDKNGDGVEQDWEYEVNWNNNPTPITGNFDAAGEAIISGKLIDNKKYWVSVYYTGQNQDWLDEVVTISDVYLLFDYLTQTDINGQSTHVFDFPIQEFICDVNYSTDNFAGTLQNPYVNSDDSYAMMAHVLGLLDGTENYWITSKLKGAMNIEGLFESYSRPDLNNWNRIITPTPSNNSFYFAAGFAGDVNFSHSTIPTNTTYNPTNVAQSQVAKMAKVAPLKAGKMLSNMMKAPIQSELDIVTELVDGNVVVSINMKNEQLAGVQIGIKYGNNLKFENVIYDTGNEMTNFANHKDGIIYVGSIDINKQNTIKNGTPYKIIFKPNTPITNTLGLISFGIKEGVQLDGTIVKFN